jgi:hypothetical protein
MITKGYKIKNLTTNEWLGIDNTWYIDINKASVIFPIKRDALYWLSRFNNKENEYQIIKIYYSN